MRQGLKDMPKDNIFIIAVHNITSSLPLKCIRTQKFENFIAHMHAVCAFCTVYYVIWVYHPIFEFCLRGIHKLCKKARGEGG